MNEAARATAAIVVIYRASADPAPLLRQLHDAVAHCVVVDNAPNGHPGVASLVPGDRLSVLHNANRGGLAGAYNRALAHLEGRVPGLQQVVLLDEDTDASALGPLLADAAVQALLANATTAAVAPAYRDRATGLRGKHIRLARWRLGYLPRRFEGIEPVAFAINSMSVWRLPALRRMGPFDEALAVDHVDTDACLRARALGLTVYVHGGIEFEHSIGQRRPFRLLGVQMQAGGHSPVRRAMIGRNTTWLARRHLWREPAFAFLCMSRLAYEAAGILMAEDHRLAKLAALTAGIARGLFGPWPRTHAMPGRLAARSTPAEGSRATAREGAPDAPHEAPREAAVASSAPELP